MDEHIAVMNAALAEDDDRLCADFVTPAQPVTFLIGLPRAGKTLFHQAVATALDIGYVSNLLARFWRAPYLGACLERDVLGGAPDSSFVSRYGNTKGPAEPGEWGWFWRHWLRLEGDAHHVGDRFDPAPLLARLAALEAAKGKPLLFNNMFAVANLTVLRERLPGMLLIDKPRDPYWVCSSILNARVARHGDVAAFFANRPRDMDNLGRAEDAVEEIVLQVKALMQEIDALYRLVGRDRVFTVEFERFLRAPRGVMADLQAFWAEHGVVAPWTGRELPDGFADRNDPRLIDPAYRDRLDVYFARHFPERALSGLSVRPQ